MLFSAISLFAFIAISFYFPAHPPFKIDEQISFALLRGLGGYILTAKGAKGIS
jgi:hypothetical protein